jgi:hypothetical protein
LFMHPVRQISPGKLETAAHRPVDPTGALRRRYRCRRRRRRAGTSYGDAVLAMAVKLDGFLALFPRNVTLRTTPPGAASYVSVNQQLIGS